MNRQEIREIERASIREFVQKHDVYLTGRVLDFGCGKPGTCILPQPYRPIVEAVHARMRAGEYVPYEIGEPFPAGHFDCVLMTQVLHLNENPARILFDLRGVSNYLVMTYPTLWEEVQKDDIYRFTKLGMERLLRNAGWEIETHVQRWSLPFEDFRLAGGYGVVAR